MLWKDNTIIVDPPKKPKKITGTRFAAILGANRWSTPFEAWCAITRTFEPPFEDTIYTIAGKTIEPVQADYVENDLFMDIRRPTDVFGPDPFKATWGDFFKSEPIFGGMWDYLELDENGKPVAVLEMKTTSRPEDWALDVPEYYALQAALYAYLLGLDQVTMVCSFLNKEDYDHPDKFVPTMSNTICRSFKLSERYPDFEQTVKKAEQWWNDHVLTGVSPAYDATKDKEIIDVLQTNNVSPDESLEDLIKAADELKASLDVIEAKYKGETESLQKRFDTLKDAIKSALVAQFNDGDKRAVAQGTYTWTVTRTDRTSYDTKAMKADGVYEKYAKASTSYMLKVTEPKGK